MPVSVISVAQMRDWENASWAAGISSDAVIQNVGKLIAKRMLELTRSGDSIILLAGRGHNGDDARTALPHLADRHATLINVTDPVLATETLVRLVETMGTDRRTWIVDGLFGIGLNRQLSDDWIGLINTVNATDLPVLAVDSPSGLNVESGEPAGAAIRAVVTLTVGAVKAGVLTDKAKPLGSESLVSTFPLTGVSSGVVGLSSTATGLQTGAVMVTGVVAVHPLASVERMTKV